MKKFILENCMYEHVQKSRLTDFGCFIKNKVGIHPCILQLEATPPFTTHYHLNQLQINTYNTIIFTGIHSRKACDSIPQSIPCTSLGNFFALKLLLKLSLHGLVGKIVQRSFCMLSDIMSKSQFHLFFPTSNRQC